MVGLTFTPKIARLVGPFPHFRRSLISQPSFLPCKASVIVLGLTLGWSPLNAKAQSDAGVEETSSRVIAQIQSDADDVEGTNNRGGGSRGCSRLLGKSGLLAWSAASAFASPSNVLTKGNQVQLMPAVLLLTDAQGLVRTRVSRPSFAWYMLDMAPVLLEFRIYRQPTDAEIAAGQFAPGDAERVLEVSGEDFVSRPGLMTLTLPDSAPSLQVGQRYWWQIEMRCDLKDPSSNTFAEARLEIASDSASPLWYDQLDQMLKAEASSEKADPIHGHLLCEQVSEQMAELLQAEMGISPQIAKTLKNSGLYPISLDAAEFE